MKVSSKSILIGFICFFLLIIGIGIKSCYQDAHALFAQTDYDKGQDRYIDTYIAADTALSKQDSEDIRVLKVENAKLETKVNVLMGVAGVLGGSSLPVYSERRSG